MFGRSNPWVLVIGTLALSLAIAGCGSAQTPPSSPQPAKAATVAPGAAAPTAAPAAVATAPAGKTVNFPEKGKTISILVGFAAGGSTDVGVRLLAPPLEKELGASVEIVNKPGAGGQLAWTQLAESKPDGYTLGVTQFPSIQSEYLDPNRKANFNESSFEPIAMEVVDPGVLAVKADSKFKTLKDLIDAAKAHPMTLSFGTAGLGSNTHFAALLLAKAAGFQVKYVHFDGVAPEMTALLGNHVDVYSGSVGDTTAQMKAGQIRILAVFDHQRDAAFMPDVPTAEELGYKVYMSSSRAISAPAKTPKAIVDLLSSAIGKAMKDPEFQQKMAQQGLTLHYMDAAETAQNWQEFDTTVKPLMSLLNVH